MEKVVKFTEFLNEKKDEKIDNWQDQISGFDNAIVLYCDKKNGHDLIKKMNLSEHGLEAFLHKEIIVIAPISGSDKASLTKFKSKFLSKK